MKIFHLIFVLFSITLAQFEDHPLEVNPDQLGQSTFIISGSNPYILDDWHYRSLRIDGNFGIPVGSFRIKDILPDFKSDSLLTTYFKWNQGDYRYRQLQLGMLSTDENGNSIESAGVGRSFPGKYSHLGPDGTSSENVLQNYMLGINRHLNQHEFEFDWLYHRENTGLPIFIFSYFNRNIESYAIGGTYRYHHPNFDSEVNTAQQITKASNDGWNLYLNNIRILNRWFSTKNRILINPKLDYQIQMEAKETEYQYQDVSTERLNYSSVYSGLEWHLSEFTDISAGLRYTDNSKFKIEFGYRNSTGILSMDISHKYLLTMYRRSDLIIGPTGWFDNRARIAVRTGGGQSDITIHFIQFEGDHFWSVNPSVSLTLPWILFSAGSTVNSADSSLFSNHSQFTIRIAPSLKHKPYKPFIQLKGVYIKSMGHKAFDLLHPRPVIIILDDEMEHTSLNASFGLVFDRFELSFNMIQFTVPGSTVSPAILPIEPMNYLQVTWIFTD